MNLVKEDRTIRIEVEAKAGLKNIAEVAQVIIEVAISEIKTKGAVAKSKAFHQAVRTIIEAVAIAEAEVIVEEGVALGGQASLLDLKIRALRLLRQDQVSPATSFQTIS
jgi:hypothetical protein